MTPRAAAVATAASTALPPLRNTSMPAAVASASTLDTAPPQPTASAAFGGGAAPAALAARHRTRPGRWRAAAVVRDGSEPSSGSS